MTAPMPETMSPREKVAKCIIGPRNPVPDSSKFTLYQLRQVKWNAASESEKSDALWAADAILTALASGSGDHSELEYYGYRAFNAGIGCCHLVANPGPNDTNPEPLVTAASSKALLAENAALRGSLTKANDGFEEYERKFYLEQDAREEAERKLAEAVATLKEIAEIEPQPFDGGLDVAAIRTCDECQRYAGHPVQRGICNTHRRPIWDREKHESREEKSLGYRAKSIARTFLSKEAERG